MINDAIVNSILLLDDKDGITSTITEYYYFENIKGPAYINSMHLYKNLYNSTIRRFVDTNRSLLVLSSSSIIVSSSLRVGILIQFHYNEIRSNFDRK